MKSLRLLLLLVFALKLSAATITVTGTGDTIAVDGACTLREAITAANTNAASGDCPAGTPGLDQIHFAIGGGGVQSISLFSLLPGIVDPVSIDGTTQPGFAGVPLIRIYQSFIDAGSIFLVETAGGGSTFRGLAVLPNFGSGIELRSSNNVVAGNYVGHDGTIAQVLTGVGVSVFGTVGAPASNNVIGGVTAADRNVFASNVGIGASVGASVGAIADANTIIGNYFGWNAAKTALLGGLNDGISIGRATNTVISGNSIAGALGSGIGITLASGTIVQFNDIGGNGTGNHTGIRIDTATNTIIGAATSGGPGGNIIVGNGTIHPETAGVLIFGLGTGNRISGNSMSFNGIPPGIAIDLFPTYGPNANDACDIDTGANLLQNKPVLTGAFEINGTVNVEGSLNSTASAPYTIEFYANPPGTGDQGHQYIGAISVMTDGSCNASFSTTLAFDPPFAGWTITATAIDASNNTSEMSAPGTIVELDPPTVAKAFNPTNIALGEESQLTITLTNPNASPITGTAFTDDYPAGLRNAAIPNVSNTCGGTVSALPGGETLTLIGGTIPANGNCTVSVFVTAVTNGSFVNDLPAGSVTSTNAPPSEGAATAALTVGAATADVPLSPAALMLLAIALSMVGAIVLRR